MAKTGRKQRKKQNAVVAQYVRPTPQREAHNDFRTAGMAMRVVPVIVRLHEQGVLNDREYQALAYYRDQASFAEQSPVKSCLNFTPGGGHGPGSAIISARLETGRIERGMGQLWQLCRAVAVDDVTLPAWCLSRHGGEAMKERADKLLGIAALELKYAAGGIVTA